ncbi:hypothetical protein Acr_16g0001310 [Actinidia rufa]|uniref:Uncharacterized protein n=1 Tax=Actinidia rufa TaxID=165716 RepID=A0A7J0FYG8_9ERIC|nr:hypothetical protein Acr_16g0001310 [Actinidia rufa]
MRRSLRSSIIDLPPSIPWASLASCRPYNPSFANQVPSFCDLLSLHFLRLTSANSSAAICLSALAWIADKVIFPTFEPPHWLSPEFCWKIMTQIYFKASLLPSTFGVRARGLATMAPCKMPLTGALVILQRAMVARLMCIQLVHNPNCSAMPCISRNLERAAQQLRVTQGGDLSHLRRETNATDRDEAAQNPSGMAMRSYLFQRMIGGDMRGGIGDLECLEENTSDVRQLGMLSGDQERHDYLGLNHFF